MTSSRAGTLLMIAVVLCAGGCGDSHEAVMRDMLNAQKELCAILEEVKDDASAKAAVPRVKAIADRLQALQKRSDALGPLPLETRAALQAKYRQEIQDTSYAVRQHFARIDPLYSLQLQDALVTLPPTPGN
jgi:hypothetical protein